MNDASDLREVVFRRYGLAVAVAREVEALHSALIKRLRDGIDTLPARTALDSYVESVGGTPNNWKYNETGSPGHWWTWYLPAGENTKAIYAGGLWVCMDDSDGRLGILLGSKMNARIPGVPGPPFREKWNGKLPLGDTSEWIQEGWVTQHIASDPDAPSLEQLIASTLTAAESHLAFLRSVYDLVLAAGGSAGA